MSIDLDPSQRAAVHLATTKRLCIITGGPGTGKTTICKEVIAQLGETSIALCSPTGKAAIRLEEQTGLPASTIHRLLSYNPGTDDFLYGTDGPDGRKYLPHAVVIADEASMIDIELGDALFSAIEPGRGTLILVGDVNQLPSVGPGAMLRDLINGGVPTARLETIHRQIESSSIPWIARAINEGMMPDFSWGNDAFFRQHEEHSKVTDEVLELVSEEIPRRHGIQPANIQVLSPMHDGPLGINALNELIQAKINPPRPGVSELGVNHADDDEDGKKKKRKPTLFREGDRVIHTVNRYDLGVMNGEVGIIKSIDTEYKIITVNYGKVKDKFAFIGKWKDATDILSDKDVSYSIKDARQLELCYCMTIHKSQGSEYDAVISVVHRSHSRMLRRQLLYTAVTRAKSCLYIVGERRAVSRAVHNTEDDGRCSWLFNRIKHGVSAE